MNTPQQPVPADPSVHVPPTIERLGTLSELTQGPNGTDVILLGLS